MSLENIINVLAGRPKRYEILDREVETRLQSHAREHMEEIYGVIGAETGSDWRDIEHEISKGPGTLKHGDELHDFAEGLGRMSYTANMPEGSVYEVNEDNYTVFYFEPFTSTEVVEENSEARFLGSPYVLGETLEFSNLDNENRNYTFAELRQPKEPLRKPLQHNLYKEKRIND